MFEKFRENRRLRNEELEELIEITKQQEEEARITEESRWGAEWTGNITRTDFTQDEIDLFHELGDRALCTKVMPELYVDNAALAIKNQLENVQYTKEAGYSWMLSAFANLRYMVEIREYLRKHPRAVIVNLDQKLNTLYFRVNNGRLRWYNVACENVLNLRNDLNMDTFSNVTQITGNPENLEWIARIPFKKGDGLIILADTAIRSWNPSQVKEMLLALDKISSQALILMNCSGGKAGRGRDRFTFYSLNAKDALHGWLTDKKTRIYATSYPDPDLLRILEGPARRDIKKLYQQGNQIVVIIKL